MKLQGLLTRISTPGYLPLAGAAASILLFQNMAALPTGGVACSTGGQLNFAGGTPQFCDGQNFVSMKNKVTGSCSAAGQMSAGAGDLNFCDGANLWSLRGPSLGACDGPPTLAWNVSVPSICLSGARYSVSTPTTNLIQVFQSVLGRAPAANELASILGGVNISFVGFSDLAAIVTQALSSYPTLPSAQDSLWTFNNGTWTVQILGCATGLVLTGNACLPPVLTQLECPGGFQYQNGACTGPSEGTNFGARFGIMYSTLACPYASGNPDGNPVYDTALILAGKQNFGAYGTWNWKSQPPDGYYCVTQRDDVLRKHAIELRDAGISFVYLDASNHPSANNLYADRPDQMVLEPLAEMLKVWSTIPGAPRIVPFVMVAQGTPDPMVDRLMQMLAQYPTMSLIKDGKPFFLVAANPSFTMDTQHLADLAASYSYRKMWQPNAGGWTADDWSFSSWCADRVGFNASSGTATCNQLVTFNNNAPEQMALSPAYASFIFSEPSQATPRYGGLTFTQQFATAFQNPTLKYAMIGDWNSWTAVDFCSKADGSLTTDATQCPAANHELVDTYTDELSRDMEPTASQGDYYYRLMKACIANFRRGLPCDPGSAANVSPIGFGNALTDAAQRACSYPGETNIPGVQTGQIEGNVDGLSVSSSRVLLSGWACIVGNSAPITIQLYLGGPAGLGGTPQGTYTTNMPAESAVQNICQTTGAVALRYQIDVTNLVNTNSGQRIYVHGINPSNGLNYFLGGSGHCAVPWPETLSGISP